MVVASSASVSLEDVATFEDKSHSFSLQGPKRKQGGAGGALGAVIDTLYSEHRYIASLLDALEEQAALLKPGRIPDYQLLLDIVDYLVNYPDQFHHPREDLLFEGMLERDPGFQANLDRLLREHETLRHYNDQLFETLTDISGGAAVNRPALLQQVNKYVAGYRKHIDYESREIFPRAKGTLSAADLKRLAARTRYLNDPIFGADVQARYRRLGRKLQAGVGSVAEEVVNREMTAIESAIEHISQAVEGLRERVPDSAFEQWPQRLDRRLNPCVRKQGPSWQARLMNTCTRTLMKPMMRFGSVESMRSMTGRFDQQQERFLAEDIQAKAVSGAGYEGEWVRIARKRPRRVVLYFPGGGFVMRTRTQHRAFVARICRSAGARALVVHYRLAPETPFPGGLEDCLAAYHDLLQQGCDPADITVAGDSAGGGLVLSTLLALRDEGTPLPANAIVLSPLADLTYSGESRKFNRRRDPMLPTHRASQMHQIYIGDALPEDRFISPVFADFDGLPPILGQVGSTEILLDDTVRAAARAQQAGVPFYLEIWREMPHVFPIFTVLPESQVAIERIADFINSSELDALPVRYGSEAPEFGRPNGSRRRQRR